MGGREEDVAIDADDGGWAPWPRVRERRHRSWPAAKARRDRLLWGVGNTIRLI